MADQVVNQTSAGGYIFYYDSAIKKYWVLLIKNLKNEWWIPKGKLEKEETAEQAALREINEEVGISEKLLTNLGLCDKVHYNFKVGNVIYEKDLYIYTFISDRLVQPRPLDWHNLSEAKWFKYEEAANKISFDRAALNKSYATVRKVLENDR